MEYTLLNNGVKVPVEDYDVIFLGTVFCMRMKSII